MEESILKLFCTAVDSTRLLTQAAWLHVAAVTDGRASGPWLLKSVMFASVFPLGFSARQLPVTRPK